MKCKVCKEDKHIMCLCGYCTECIELYGHEKCKKLEGK
jgi:hypothetical protein